MFISFILSNEKLLQLWTIRGFKSLDNLEKHEKEYRRLKQQQNLKNENLICAYTALLPNPNNVNVCGVKKNKEQKQIGSCKRSPCEIIWTKSNFELENYS